MNLATLESAYVLHYYPYRDTSVIVDLFTEHYGRISVVARGARSARSRLKGLIQPFVPLVVSWTGKTELTNLRHIEQQGIAAILTGQSLLSGFYINELIIRLIPRHDPYSQLFAAYRKTLTELQQANHVQVALRLFEKQLLEELGYRLPIDHEVNTGAAIQSEQYYYFDPNHGLSLVPSDVKQTYAKHIFHGQSLLAIQAGIFNQVTYLRDAKRLMRLALAPLLGDKPLHSRELFDFKAAPQT